MRLKGEKILNTRPTVVHSNKDGQMWALHINSNNFETNAPTQTVFEKGLPDLNYFQQQHSKNFYSTANFEAVFNANEEKCLIITDTSGLINHFNKGAEILLGYQWSEVVGKISLPMFFDEKEIIVGTQNFSFNQKLGKFNSNFLEALDINEINCSEKILIKKGNEKLFVNLKVTSIFNTYNDVSGYLFTIIETREPIKSNNVFSDSVTDIRAIFEASQHIIYTHDIHGKFLTINTEGAKTLGINKDLNYHKNLLDIIPYGSNFNFEKYINELTATGKSRGSLEIIKHNGQIITCIFNNVIGKDINNNNYVIGNFIDITERVVVEKDLLKQKLTAENNIKMKDMFLANMSHEIRTPLNTITGFGKLLTDTALDIDQTEYVNAMNIATANLLGIINDVLDMFKIESGQISLEKIPFNFNEQIQNVRKILIQNANAKNIQFICDIDTELQDILIGDPTRLSQVLVNLLNNAIKFTEKGYVKLNVDIVTENTHNYLLKFIVSDTGIGIPADKIDIIFDRFTQAHADTTRKYGGTGLGLSISKSLVELLGGRLKVESRESIGSSFSFSIPFAKNKTDDLKKYNGESLKEVGNNNSTRILVAEDNILNQKLVQRILEKQGHDVIIAENGNVAIDLLKNGAFDIVLMDLQMPELDGYQTTKYIRETLKLNLPIIALTASSNPTEIDNFSFAGINDYILKPYDAETLFEKINALTIKKEIDLSYLKSISDNNKEFEKELIESFIYLIPIELDSLKLSVNNNDIKGIKAKAHKLRSSYSVVGIDANELLDQLEYLESKNIINAHNLIISLQKIQLKAIENLEQELKENYNKNL
jgi:PAS domain S-box-containing protein